MAEEKREEAFEQRAEHSPSSLVRAVSSERMRILITNDDGIHSEGLDVCAEIGRALSDDVWVIAPASAASRSRARRPTASSWGRAT